MFLLDVSINNKKEINEVKKVKYIIHKINTT